MNHNPNIPVMPKATAVWLVENTALTFKQIADFCGMHELEIKGIADGEVAQGIMGVDPIMSGQLDKTELERCLKNPEAKLKLAMSNIQHLISKKKSARYTPIARRQDKPDAIFWLIKNYPDIHEGQIIKLIGTTKSTIEAIKERTHWNSKNIKPRDPVLLGLCTQMELNEVLKQFSTNENNKEEE